MHGYHNSLKWLFSSILYASYNSIILIPMLISMRTYVKNKRQIIRISILITVIILILAFCVFGLLYRGSYFISDVELPLIYIAGQFGISYQYLYGVIIIVSIFTSAIAAGYSFVENKKLNMNKRNWLIITICVSSIMVSNLGFSDLVNVLYPVFGVIGVVQIIMILIWNNREIKTNVLQKKYKTVING